MKTLLIVESPSKCKIIEKYLGDGYKVVASCGHFRSLNNLEQIKLDSLDVKYTNDKPKIIKMLKEEIEKVDEVILATDNDREGEAIAWHICQTCKLPLTTKRILFQEITKSALLIALQNPTTINMNRVYSQQSRQILDIYIGFKISPVLWKHIQHTLSAGRCQTPALRMIYEKDQLIKNQSYITDYLIYGSFTSKNIEFKINTHFTKEEIIPFLEKCKETKFTIKKGDAKQHTLKQPDILITSSLQQKANQSLGMSPQQIMRNAQTLYENGFITYMRTDCSYYSDEFIKKTNDYIKKEYGEKYIGNIVLKEKKAHEGIRITQHDIKKVDIEPSVNRLYDFIYKYTLQTCMSPNITVQTPYVLNYDFTYLSTKTIFDGWKILNNKEPTEDYSLYLDNITNIKYNKITAEEKCVDQEYHYNESQLIKKLEKENIGRPSTYVSILESIEKKYVNKGTIIGQNIKLTNYELHDNTINVLEEEKQIKEENKLSITELGIKVSEFCNQYFNSLFEYRFTERMEKELDLIEEGSNTDWKKIVKYFINEVDTLLKVDIQCSKPEYKSLHCGYLNKNAIVLKDGPYGFYVEYKKNSISLKKFKSPELIHEWIVAQHISQNELNELIEYIKNKDGYVISNNISIRNGPNGYYIMYKKPTMKKPKFYDCKDIIELIETNETEKIKIYIENKYKIL
jgi:DNA topoisomerase-1